MLRYSTNLNAKTVRFRNLVVHEYEETDPAMLFDLAQNYLGDFRKFRNEIDQASG